MSNFASDAWWPIFSGWKAFKRTREQWEAEATPGGARAGEQGEARREENADRGVDLISRKLENGSKRGLKITFQALRAHRQHYRTHDNVGGVL